MTVLNWAPKFPKELSLISSIESPSCPPEAALGLFTNKESNMSCAVEESKSSCWNLIVPSIVFNKLASIFALTPPPTKFLIVKVVLLGAIP